jgi:serine/threonine-protein kinase
MREINPNISQRAERAILWALNLHPDDRPQTVDAFQEALLGDWSPTTRPRSHRAPTDFAGWGLTATDRGLTWVVIAFLALSLLVTLMR